MVRCYGWGSGHSGWVPNKNFRPDSARACSSCTLRLAAFPDYATSTLKSLTTAIEWRAPSVVLVIQSLNSCQELTGFYGTRYAHPRREYLQQDCTSSRSSSREAVSRAWRLRIFRKLWQKKASPPSNERTVSSSHVSAKPRICMPREATKSRISSTLWRRLHTFKNTIFKLASWVERKGRACTFNGEVEGIDVVLKFTIEFVWGLSISAQSLKYFYNFMIIICIQVARARSSLSKKFWNASPGLFLHPLTLYVTSEWMQEGRACFRGDLRGWYKQFPLPLHQL